MTGGCASYAKRVRANTITRASAAATVRARALYEAAQAAQADSIATAQAAVAARALIAASQDTAMAAINAAIVEDSIAQAFLRDTAAAKREARLDGWDSRAALSLMQRASVRRAAPLADTALHNYRGTAEGYLYLYSDRPSAGQRTLIRVNQIGLEMFWRQPGTWRQRVVAMRHESALPNGGRFHLDHFTMVQNGFGNNIRVGGGDEVRDVMHPAAPGARSFYHFRIADSLELKIDGRNIRVYEVHVRPRDPAAGGIVGSVFLEQATAAIVRMSFTFTPSSYVDRSIDYINISLDNAMYNGKYWLANEQLVEVRRSMPVFDLGVGSVIRSRIHLRGYDLNVDIPDSIFRAPPIVGGRRALAKDFEFEQGIYEDLDRSGLRQPPQLIDLRKEAEDMLLRDGLLKQAILSGLPPVRLYAQGVSSLLRYNRAEGLYLGTGISYTPRPAVRYDVLAGYALGSDRRSLQARAIRQFGGGATSEAGGGDLMAEAYLHRSQDFDPVHVGATSGNSLSSIAAARDYLDTWYRTGARASVGHTIGSASTARVGIELSEERSASLVKSRAMLNRGAHFRDVLPIDPGRDVAGTLSVTRTCDLASRVSWSASVDVRAGVFESRTYARPVLTANAAMFNESRTRNATASFVGGMTTSANAAQQQFLFGGRGTLPGYDYRSFGGTRIGLLNATVGATVVPRWLGVRVIGGAAASDRVLATRAMRDASWLVRDTDGVRTSAGAGISLLWNMLHIDAMRGLNHGHWEMDIAFGRSAGNVR